MRPSWTEPFGLDEDGQLGGEVLSRLAVLRALVEHQQDGDLLEFLCQDAAEAGTVKNNVLLFVLLLEVFERKRVAELFELLGLHAAARTALGFVVDVLLSLLKDAYNAPISRSGLME